MELYERDFFLSRIIAGYEKVKIKGQTYKVISPTTDIMYDANDIYMEVFHEAQQEELLYDEDIYSLLVYEGLWTKSEELMLTDTLPQLILDFQKEMFRSAYRATECAEHRQNLMKTREKMNYLHNIRHQFDSYTCHGVAMYAKYHYIIENTTYCEDGSLFTWDKFPVSTVIEKCNNTNITGEQIREISHTAPWINQWQSIKSLGNLFKKPGVELTNYQQWLLMYSKMYDNINESPDCPDDFILDDDDLLDGWILTQRDIRDKERAEKQGTTLVKNSKLEKANEVFIVAESPEAVDRINKMNNARGNAVKKHRLKQVYEKGEVQWKNFSDVKQEALTELAAAKGKR